MSDEPRIRAFDLDPGELPQPARPTPTTLLCAQFRAVEFAADLHGPVMEEVLRWCEGDGPSALMVVAGPAGVGKTRLLVEVGRRLRASGWDAGFLVGRLEATPVPRLARPTLVIVDYADMQPILRDALAAWVRSSEEAGARLRVVLVARAIGEWWRALEGDRHLLAWVQGCPFVELGAQAINEEVGARIRKTAAVRFAGLLARPVPALPERPVPAGRGVLWILADALCSVLGKSTTEPFAAIVGHEENVWSAAMRHRLASDRLLRSFLRYARMVVAALVLRGGAGALVEVAALLRRLGGGEYGEFAEVLHELYPGASEGQIRPLEPDYLGETLVMRSLQQYPDCLEKLLEGANAGAAERAPHVLLRVAQRADVGQTRWLDRLLAWEPGTFAPGCVTAVLAASPEPTALHWAASLARTLEERGDPELAHRLLARIPPQTLALVEVGAWASEAVARWIPPIDQPGWSMYRVDVYHRAARFMSQVEGGVERALLWSRAAARLLRERLAQDPEVASSLAVVLHDQVMAYMKLDMQHAALTVADECIGHCRAGLVGDEARRLEWTLAGCLDHRGMILARFGEYKRAIESTEEAVAIFRRLGEAEPGSHRHDLASALDNLGGRYGQDGQFARSLEVSEEALMIFRALSVEAPDRVFVDLQICLTALAARRARAGDLAGGCAAIEEALDSLRPRAIHRADLQGMLASAINNAAALHRLAGRDDLAAQEQQEAAALWLQGAPRSSNQFYTFVEKRADDTPPAEAPWRLESSFELDASALAQVQASLHDERSRVLHQLGAHAEALAEAEAAVEALETVSGGQEFEGHHMVLLNNLANRQADAGAAEKALETTRLVLARAEHVTATGDPNGWSMRPMARMNLAVRYRETGSPAAGVPWAEAAVAELRARREQDPEVEGDLAQALGILGRCLEESGDVEAAAEATAEADRVDRERVARELGVLEFPEPIPVLERKARLHALLVDGFSPEALRAWLAEQPRATPVLASLPAAPVSADALVSAVVAGLELHGLVDAELFARLYRMLPRRTLQISVVHALWDAVAAEDVPTA